MKKINEKGRRWISSALAGLLTVSSFFMILPVSPVIAASDSILVYIDGKKVAMDPAPRLQSGRTLVPIRLISEELGAMVAWDETDRTIKVNNTEGQNVTLWADNRLVCYEQDGRKTYDVCDVPSQIIDGRTYVPLRLVGNALGISVNWNGVDRSVRVDSDEKVQKTLFSSVSVNGLTNGRTVTGTLPLTIEYQGGVPAGAAQVRYLMLDAQTGSGKIVARSTTAQGVARWAPDPAEQGSRIIAAAVCDAQGNFLAGTAVTVDVNVTPQISMTGLKSNQVITDSIDLSCKVNFAAESVAYEFKNLATGQTTQSQAVDPMGTYTFVPAIAYNGAMEIRAIAADGSGGLHYSEAIPVTVAVEKAPDSISLKKFNAENVGKVPVTLSVTRNFDVTTTQYWARNTGTGEKVLLKELPYGDFQWFPGPDMAGTWDIYVNVVTPAGKEYTTAPLSATVPKTPSLILKGVGPDEVVTEAIELAALSNVPLQSVEFLVKNPFNGTKKILGTITDAAQTVSWTPQTINEGTRIIQATAVTAEGETVTSEPITIKIYLGTLYSARPVAEKDLFISYITPLALATQKENGMSAALQVAQAVLESGWGQSLPVDKYSGQMSYNLFGIKGTGPAGTVLSNTWEEYYGTKYRIDAKFRAYNNIRESWNDHNSLLLTKDRYVPYTEVMFNSTWGAYALRRCGYATDSNYPGKLIKIINTYHLDELDLQKL
jgi:flagellum-specific peptidoglycan hydrolase FlgJ